MKSLFTIFIIFFASLMSQAQQNEPNYPPTIPTFQFAKIKGDGIFNSSSIKKNKKTLIGFVSPECIHCLLSIEHLNNNTNYLKDVNVILVTEYDKDLFMAKFNSIGQHLNELKSFEILQDTDYEFGPLFSPLTLPTFYLFDKKGNLETVKRGSVEINQIFNYLK